ncbi:MAG TPA: energy transducer TonB [Thermoanaerobaculia bacterium]|jgi:TonB family protein|nr:energy transducer TonB [Thermoanaerobaculia bacterium]
MIRRLILTVSVAAWCAALYAQSDDRYSVSMRSRHHEMVIDVRPLGQEEVQYDVRIIDLATGAVVAQPRLTAKVKGAAEVTSESSGIHYIVHVQAMDGNVNAHLTVEQDGMITDMLRTFWNNVPHRARLRVPGAVRAEDAVNPPQIVKYVEPVYTEAARKNRVEGYVLLDIRIDKTGDVRDIVILQELPWGLPQAASDAVKQWKFRPATTRDGTPVESLISEGVTFRLPPEPARAQP